MYKTCSYNLTVITSVWWMCVKYKLVWLPVWSYNLHLQISFVRLIFFSYKSHMNSCLESAVSQYHSLKTYWHTYSVTDWHPDKLSYPEVSLCLVGDTESTTGIWYLHFLLTLSSLQSLKADTVQSITNWHANIISLENESTYNSIHYASCYIFMYHICMTWIFMEGVFPSLCENKFHHYSL